MMKTNKKDNIDRLIYNSTKEIKHKKRKLENKKNKEKENA